MGRHPKPFTNADSPRDPSAGRNGVAEFGPLRLGHFALDEFKRAAGPCDLHRPHLCHRRLHVVKLSSDAMMRVGTPVGQPTAGGAHGPIPEKRAGTILVT